MQSAAISATSRGRASDSLCRGSSANWSAKRRRLAVRAGGKQKRNSHRIKDGDKRQGQQPNGSLQVRSRHADQLGEISHRTYVGFRAATVYVRLNFLDS